MLNKITAIAVVILLFGFVSLQAQNQGLIEAPLITGDETPDLSSNPVIEVTGGYVFDPVISRSLTYDFHSIDPATFTGYDFQSNTSTQQVWMDPNNPLFLHAVFANSQETAAWTDRTCLYYGSVDAGLTWFQLGPVPVNNGTDGRSGFPVMYGTSTGAGVIANHNNSDGTTTHSKVFIDGSAFEYNFTTNDPGVPAAGDAIWPRIVLLPNDDGVIVSSVNAAATGVHVNNWSAGVFGGWQTFDGGQGEGYGVAISESGAKVGMVFEGQGTIAHDIFYQESTDGGLTWSDSLHLWAADYTADTILAHWRGIDIEFLGEDPCLVWEIGSVGTGESFDPAHPSKIYFWSPNINGGVPKILADDSNVPFFTNGTGSQDASMPLGKPVIGRSQENGYLFVAFAATSGEVWTQTADSTAYFAGHFMYSSDGGETWTDPEVFTPSGSPLLDWRYPSIVPSSPVSALDDNVITVHMVMQGDTIPASNVSATIGTMPVAVSAQYYHISTEIILVGVDDDISAPLEFTLVQNYPNPFNPSTSIKYSLAAQSPVTLKVYDILGNEVATLVNTVQGTGVYEVNFNASNLASGLYFYTLKAGNFTSTKKMMLLK
jgi:hypothetical protein